MQELTLEEVNHVSGGMPLEAGLNLIGGISAAAMFIGAPVAAAFGAGVFLGGMLAMAFD